jgi:phage regulator Rha-like protein
MDKELIINDNLIKDKIHYIRGKQVILDRDIAELYEVETRVLNQAIKRNKKRFPEDFMYQLTKDELLLLRLKFEKNWMSQNVTSNYIKMGLRKQPYVFTEHGVTALAGVLKSQKAIEINIKIIKAFISMRKFLI